MIGLWRDVRFGMRLLLRRPGLAVTAVLSLVLGIGLNTALFTLLQALYVRPLPVADPATLAAVHQTSRDERGEYVGRMAIAWDNFLVYRDAAASVEDLAIFHRWPMSLTGGSSPERVMGAYVSSNYFDLLGVRPALGRLFQPQDDRAPGEAAVAVLGHGCWSRLFGADPEVLGRTVEVNGRGFTVVGVAAEGFRGTEIAEVIDVWLPATMFPEVSPFAHFFRLPDVGVFWGIARLAPGVSRAAAQAELHDISVEHSKVVLQNNESQGIEMLPLVAGILPPAEYENLRARVRLLAGAAILVLLIACLNVASLLLVRGVERSRELALRQAVGAGRRTVARQLVVESLVLFALGGVLSLPVARGTLTLFWWRLRPPTFSDQALDLHLPWTSLGFALLLALVSGLASGLLPALRASRPDLVTCLKEGGITAPVGRLRFQPRSLLVTAQVALALVALVGAGLFLRSLHNTQRIDLGFDPENLAVVRISPGEQGYDEVQTEQIYEQAIERLETLPGVRSVALSENRLLRGGVIKKMVYLDGEAAALASPDGLSHRTNAVSPGFFSTAGIPLQTGRDFDQTLRPDGPLEVIVNETMARIAWPGEEAVGKVVHFDYPNEPPVEVIGVAADARYRRIRENRQFFFYLPLSQHPRGSVNLHVRTEGDPTAVIPLLRRELLDLDERLVLSEVGTMRSFLDEALWSERAAFQVLAAFGLLAVLLAVVGVSGVVAYSVSRRWGEISIRRALGAGPGKVLRGILAEAVWVVGGGIALGWLLGYFVLRPMIANQLVEVSAADPATYAFQALLLAAVALAASLVPASRALRSDPMAALRSE